MNYYQAQMLQMGTPIEFNNRQGVVARRLFDDAGLVSHLAFEWSDTKERTGLIDAREMGAVRLVKEAA